MSLSGLIITAISLQILETGVQRRRPNLGIRFKQKARLSTTISWTLTVITTQSKMPRSAHISFVQKQRDFS